MVLWECYRSMDQHQMRIVTYIFPVRQHYLIPPALLLELPGVVRLP